MPITDWLFDESGHLSAGPFPDESLVYMFILQRSWMDHLCELLPFGHFDLFSIYRLIFFNDLNKIWC